MANSNQADLDASVENLRAALRFPTISHEDPGQLDNQAFRALGAFFEQTYPLIHKQLDLELFDHSRLYFWPGADLDADPAALFIAHQDVVPVTDPSAWSHGPFDGDLADGYIWGRGAIDDKSRIIAWLETIESALAQGFRPRRSILIAFGHDEELGGRNGAAQIAEALKARGITTDFVLDEGGLVGDRLVRGLDRQVASIMLGEKGFVTIRLSTTDPGGHASIPPKLTAVGRIAKAVNAVQSHPFPLRLTPAILDMLTRIAPHASFGRRAILASAHRLAPAVLRLMAQQPETEALVRTTTAPTVIRGGAKDNVLPQSAEALINFRILLGDSVAGVAEHCRKVIKDERVRVDISPGMIAEPSPVTDSNAAAFGLISQIVADVIPEAAITTGIVTGATDSRHYCAVAKDRINFAPIVLDRTEISRIHGTDERISLENFARLLDFNSRLLARL